MQRLTNFLISQDLGYPNYDEWIQRAEAEVESGWKTAVLAFYEGHLIGDLISQPHKEIPGFLELKNMRVHPDFRGRYFAKFMLRQAELDFGAGKDAIICDVPADQPNIIEFMQTCGYSPILITPLYSASRKDIIMLKILGKSKEDKRSGLILTTRNIVLANAILYN